MGNRKQVSELDIDAIETQELLTLDTGDSVMSSWLRKIVKRIPKKVRSSLHAVLEYAESQNPPSDIRRHITDIRQWID